MRNASLCALVAVLVLAWAGGCTPPSLPTPAAEEPALLWEGQQDDGTCQSLRLSLEGWPAIGPCDEPARSLPYFGYRQYLGLWPDWLTRFAPFEAETPSGRVIFRGQGGDEASPAWQRALGEWARLVWMELQFGRSGASWGTALAGHWPTSDRSGYCQFLQVETYGYVYASIARCGGGEAYDLGRGWLETSEWLPFDAWLYGRAAVYRQELDFFGSADQAMSDDEQDTLSRWAESVYSRLTQGIPVPLAVSDIQTRSAPSPDGRWIAKTLMVGPFLVGEGEQYRTQLSVLRTDGTRQWTVVDETSHYGLGYTVPSPFHWSRDGRYLYFTNLPLSDGCAVFVNGSDLYRVSLEDGSVAAILANGAWWLSLSPDEHSLAYLRWNGQALELVLRDVATGRDEHRREFAAHYAQGGNILWSPEGTALVLTLVASPCDPADWKHAVVRVGVATMTQTKLIADDGRRLVTEEWSQPETVRLADKDGNSWWLDAVTGEVTRAD